MHWKLQNPLKYTQNTTLFEYFHIQTLKNIIFHVVGKWNFMVVDLKQQARLVSIKFGLKLKRKSS